MRIKAVFKGSFKFRCPFTELAVAAKICSLTRTQPSDVVLLCLHERGGETLLKAIHVVCFLAEMMHVRCCIGQAICKMAIWKSQSWLTNISPDLDFEVQLVAFSLFTVMKGQDLHCPSFFLSKRKEIEGCT